MQDRSFEKIQFLLEHDISNSDYSDNFNSLLNIELSENTISAINEFFPDSKIITPLTEKSLNELLSLFNGYFQKIKEAKCIIPVMGPRWSGKSSFLYYLAGISLEKGKEPETPSEQKTESEMKLSVNISEPSWIRTLSMPALVTFNQLTFLECPDLDFFQYDSEFKTFLIFILHKSFVLAKNLASPIMVINSSPIKYPGHAPELRVGYETINLLKLILGITKKWHCPSVTFCFSNPFSRNSEVLTSDYFREICLFQVNECIRHKQSEIKRIMISSKSNSIENKEILQKLSNEIDFLNLFKKSQNKIFCFLNKPDPEATIEGNEEIIKYIRRKINQELYFSYGALKQTLNKKLTIDTLLFNTAIYLTCRDNNSLVQTCKSANESAKNAKVSIKGRHYF